MQETFSKIFIQNSLITSLQDHSLKLILILVVAFAISKFSTRFIERLIRKIVISKKYSSPEAEKKREDTLIKVLNSTIQVLLWILASMMVLSEVGIDIGPVIAAAGVAGIAFGFGGQYLIRDIISGLFILLENQYRVGDVVAINDKAGLVEGINLRLTILRDLDGTLHYIPNGEVKTASNMSKDFSRINIKLGVAYNSNMEKISETINKIGQEITNDPEWKDSIIDAPKFVRIEEFADSAIIIRILGETRPLRQWDVSGEVRKRIKIAFDREGIEIPFPQRSVHIENKSSQ